MLNENQLQKLINKGLTCVFITKENEGFELNMLTEKGWSSKELTTEEDLADIVNEYKYQPDILVEIDSEINI